MNKKRGQMRTLDIYKILKLSPIAIILFVYAFISPPQGLSPAGWSAFLVFLITIYLWATGMLNLSVTAILSMLLLILTSAATLPEAVAGFSTSALFLILAGFFISCGLTASGLDKRIAHLFMDYCTTEKSIFAGIITVTAALSMMMSNTTTVLLMLPIVANIASQSKVNKVALYLLAAFSANIGGVGFLIGTPPNLIGAELLHMDFLGWFVIGFPFAVVMAASLYLSFYLYFKPGSKHIEIRNGKLKPMSAKERYVTGVICLSLLLWFTSPLHNLSAVSVGLLAGVLLMLTVYSWSYFQKNTDWGVVFLIGGAISLGDVLLKTGAATWMADMFLKITGLQNPLWISFGFVLFALTMTQFIQNTATAAIIAPVLASLAANLNISPLALVMPMTLGVSMTFLLPSGTAPNAIVFNAAKISIRDFVRIGLLPTIFAIIVLFGLCWLLI